MTKYAGRDAARQNYDIISNNKAIKKAKNNGNCSKVLCMIDSQKKSTGPNTNLPRRT